MLAIYRQCSGVYVEKYEEAERYVDISKAWLRQIVDVGRTLNPNSIHGVCRTSRKRSGLRSRIMWAI
jgi:hypothetical protein